MIYKSMRVIDLATIFSKLACEMLTDLLDIDTSRVCH